MKKTLILLLLISSLFADEFIVKSFSILEKDLSARKEVQYDINGEACALIKVRTDINKTLSFDSNMGIPVAPIQKQTGEYWVYVAKGERALKCMAEEFIPKQIPLQGGGIIKSLTVYELILTSKNLQELSVEGDMYSLTFNMNTNNVYIQKDNSAKMLTTGFVAGYELPQGEYTFVFQKEGYRTHTERVDLVTSKQVDIELKTGQSDFRASLPGIIMVKTEPNGAEIYLNNKYVGITPYQGELQEGEYELKLIKEKFYEVIKRFTLNAGKYKELPLVELRPNYAIISYNTVPAGATVYLDGQVIGQTPIINQKIKSGKHKIRVKKELFKEYVEELDLKDEEVIDRKRLKLEKNFGSLMVDSKNIDGAQVYLNGKFLGETPVNKDSIECGSYDMTIKKNKYKESREKLEITQGVNKRLVVLLQNFGTLDIVAQNCEIYINNDLAGENEINKTVLPGKYIIKAIHYEVNRYPDSTEVFIGIGETKHIDLAPEYILGSVSVISDPTESAGASIYVNDELYEEKTPTILTLPIGTYTIRVKHKDYLTNVHAGVVVAENSLIQERFELMTYSGSLKAKEDMWRKRKNWAFASSIFIAGAGGAGGQYMGWEKYIDYTTATSTADANSLRKQSDAFFLARDISYGVSISSLAYAAFALIQEQRYRYKQKQDNIIDENLVSISNNDLPKMTPEKVEEKDSTNTDNTYEQVVNTNPKVEFIPYDTPPIPIGGQVAISRNVVYPRNAKKEGIEGQIVVQTFINEKGIAEQFVIYNGMPDTGFNEAAINAIKKTRFKPAKQGNKKVGVWISIPITFKI